MKIQVLHTFKSYIAEAAIILTVLYGVMDRFTIRAYRPWLHVGLGILALLSIGAYFDFGHYSPIPYYINRHDFFHYYMGAKYRDEVGYLHLYPACVIVDRENNPQYRNNSVRDQEDYREYPTIREIMAKEEFYKGLFAPQRWEEFEKDVLYFRELMGTSRWQRALRDKGFNATPTWTMAGHFITNRVPTDSERGQRFLLLLDPMLITAMFLLAWYAFGWRATLFALIFFGTNFMMNQTHIKGSLLRQDWVTLMVMATCCLKLRWYSAAGAMMGYSAMMRIFPVIFCFGIGVKLVWDASRRLSEYRAETKQWVSAAGMTVRNAWKNHHTYLRFFIAFAVMIVALFSASLLFDDNGMETWRTYLRLINMHNDDVMGVRAGFKYVYLMTYQQTPGMTLYEFKDDRNKSFHDFIGAWYFIQFLVLGVSFFAVRNLEDYETIPYGIVPAFFLVAPTFYYYVMLIVPFFLFAPKIHLVSRNLGQCLFFSFSAVGYMLYKFLGLNYPLFFWCSVMILGLVAYTVVVSFKAGREHAPMPAAGESMPEAHPAKTTPAGS